MADPFGVDRAVVQAQVAAEHAALMGPGWWPSSELQLEVEAAAAETGIGVGYFRCVTDEGRFAFFAIASTMRGEARELVTEVGRLDLPGRPGENRDLAWREAFVRLGVVEDV